MPSTESEGVRYSAPRVKDLSRDTLELSNDTIFIVDANLRISYCNPAWDRFARANGGEEVVAARVLGNDLMCVIPEPLRDFYAQVFRSCHVRKLTFDIDYECSSPEQYRLLHMSILPLEPSGSLAFVNSIRVERPHGSERPALPSSENYFGDRGMVTVCCHCRRTQRQDASGQWDWVPAFIHKGKWQVSHGICPMCVSYFYWPYLPKD
jgi:hypothetical protein